MEQEGLNRHLGRVTNGMEEPDSHAATASPKASPAAGFRRSLRRARDVFMSIACILGGAWGIALALPASSLGGFLACAGIAFCGGFYLVVTIFGQRDPLLDFEELDHFLSDLLTSRRGPWQRARRDRDRRPEA